VPAIVALPAGERVPALADRGHDWREREADLDGYVASGLCTETMGRQLAEDSVFFSAALAGGVLLGELALGRPTAQR
jgi:hypothetical protein